MSREGVAAFLTRVMEDEGFREELKARPDATLAQFELTPDEVEAIKSADPSKIQELGVDERVSKTVSAERFIPMSQSVDTQTWLPHLTEILRYVFHP